MTSRLHRVSRFGVVNAYLVVEDDGITVVDTTIKGGGKAIMKAAERLGQPIVRIALTHAHADHIGGVDELAAALPGVEVLISERDAPLMTKTDMSLRDGEPHDKLRGGYPGAKTAPTATFAPGDRVGSLEVIAAPGHTPGHVAFLDPRDRTLLCGDAYSTLGGVATSAKANPRFPLPAMGTWSRAVELESAKALRALEPARLAPGHGKIVESPVAAMDAAIAKAS
jgi:glyoxylase-like metal-dependent hydrolase (beta-lactamase superfamily II)